MRRFVLHLDKKGTQDELDWSSLTGSDYNKFLENLPSRLCFLIHHDTHDHTVNLEFIFELISFRDVRNTRVEDIFEKCKGWVNDFLALGSLGRKGFDSVTPYMHCLVYHVPFFTKQYGNRLRFSGQGLEKINDDIKRKHHSKRNKWEAF